MIHGVNDNEPIVSSEDDTQGGEMTAGGSFGGSLLPVLIGLIVLSLAAVSAVALIATAFRG
ncbi:hypothetical protein [Hyphomonas sp.]|uniref:hypothetical protein n=1 Tax=Hyphomonas sp. TaxID=87 RepID=UPI00391C9F86